MDTTPGAAEREAAEEELEALYGELETLRERIAAARGRWPAHEVPDFELSNASGPVRLSDLFGDGDELVVVHNMGRRCPMCTLWADGLNGLAEHLLDRCAVVVTSPDTPEVQRAFATARGWRLPMVSTAGTDFAAELGFVFDGGMPAPGLSVFQREGATLRRTARTWFGPGDDFCAVFHILPLLPRGQDDWWPRIDYDAADEETAGDGETAGDDDAQ